MTAPFRTAWLFARSAEWIIEATTPRADGLVQAAALIRAKVRRGFDAAKATRIRQAIKRFTDAFT